MAESGGGGEDAAVHLTEIDGVRTVWSPTPGPLTAGLLLRMGPADESLPHRGHSHMLEHLALFGLGRPGDHSNGQVDGTTTLLHASGTPEEVATFLTRVTQQLVDPPTARLEDEKGVLRAEQARRGRHPLTELQIWRWGVRSYGAETSEEFGLDAMSGESVRSWARFFATRQNAVLWLTGPPPAGVTLALPDGPAVPGHDPRVSMLPFLPAYFRSQAASVVVHALVDRTFAGPALARVVRNRLVDDLRTERAAAYSPQAGYQPLNGDVAALVAASDMVPGHEQVVFDRVLSVLGELASALTTVRPEELAEYRADTLRAWASAKEVSRAPSQAWDLLHGKPMATFEELRAGLLNLTEEAVWTAAGVAARTILLQAPGTVQVPPPWQPAPLTTIAPVTAGRTHRHVATRARLTVGPEGATLNEGTGLLTVRRDRLAVMGRWDDGGRLLIADDGLRLTIEPTLWRRGARAVATIDSAVPDAYQVRLGARSTDAIPRASWQARLRRHYPALMVTAGLALLVGVLVVAASTGHGDAIPPGLVAATAATAFAIRRARQV